MMEHMHAEGADPPQDDPIDQAGGGETIPPQRARFEFYERLVGKRASEEISIRMQKRVLAMRLEGATDTDIMGLLEQMFSIRISQSAFHARSSDIEGLRNKFAVADEEFATFRKEARVFVIEHRPREAWHLVPESRACLVFLLVNTAATHVQIANIMSRILPTIDPKIMGFRYQNLTDILAAERRQDATGVYNPRQIFAEELSRVPDILPPEMKERMSEVARHEFEKEVALKGYPRWIFDDKKRALLVALLELEDRVANPPAIAEAMNMALDASEAITPSFIYIRLKQYGGRTQFADHIRAGIEHVLAGQREQARHNIERHAQNKEAHALPKWLRSSESGTTEEKRAFLITLLTDESLSYALMTWAFSAKFEVAVSPNTLKAYVLDNESRQALVKTLRQKNLSDKIVKEMASVDFTRLPGYEAQSEQWRNTLALAQERKQRIADVEALNNSELMKLFVTAIEKGSGKYVNIPRIQSVTFDRRYIRESNQDALALSGISSAILKRQVTIEFMTFSEVKSQEENTKRIHARTMYDLLIRELRFVTGSRREMLRKPYSALLKALVGGPRDEPVLFVRVKSSPESVAVGTIQHKIEEFRLDEDLVRIIRTELFGSSQ